MASQSIGSGAVSFNKFLPLGDPKKKGGLQLVQLRRFWEINGPQLPYYFKERKS
jgi:hypothetical protein